MSVKAARRFYRVESSKDLQYLDAGESASAENRWTFEIAWEVANKGETAIDYSISGTADLFCSSGFCLSIS